MAEVARFFNAVLQDGVYDRRYSSNDLAAMVAALVSDGVMPEYANKLKVLAPSTAGMSVRVCSGAAFIRGRMYENTATMNTTIPTAPSTSGQKRIDRIVVRLSLLQRTIQVAVLSGAAAVTPTAPALTQSTEDVWELSLAKVTIPAGATAITSAMIEDERPTEFCGYCQWMVNNVDFSDIYANFSQAYQEMYEADAEAFDNLYRAQNNAFSTWFATIKDVLDGNTAGHLQNEIEDIRPLRIDFSNVTLVLNPTTGRYEHRFTDADITVGGSHITIDMDPKLSLTLETLRNFSADYTVETTSGECLIASSAPLLDSISGYISLMPTNVVLSTT